MFQSLSTLYRVLLADRMMPISLPKDIKALSVPVLEYSHTPLVSMVVGSHGRPCD